MTKKSSSEVAKVKREKLAACMTCPLCNDLFTDATTISECLHTFCRKCIYEKITEEDINSCPVCKTDLGVAPLEKLRVDNSLQDLRLKLFPSKQVKPAAPEMFPLPAKRRERSLSSLGASTSRAPRRSYVTGRRSKLPLRRKTAPEESTHPINIEKPAKEVEDRPQNLSSPRTHSMNAETKMQNYTVGESSKQHMPDQDKENHAEALEVQNHTIADSSEQQILNSRRENHVETVAGIADLWNPLNHLVEAASKEEPHKSSEVNVAKPTVINLFGNKVYLSNVGESGKMSKFPGNERDSKPPSVEENGNMSKVPGNETDSISPSVKISGNDPKIPGNENDSMTGPSTSARPRRSRGIQQKKIAFLEDLNLPALPPPPSPPALPPPPSPPALPPSPAPPAPAQALADGNSNNFDAISIPIWFTLLASVDQEGNEPLPQISSRYLRVKDRNLTVLFIKKYLAQKLGLFSEAEVEISLAGQPVGSSLEIHHLVDFWVHTTPLSERREATVGSSGREFVMKLFYSRKLQPVITISD
ncbi:hypothetical protein SLA2020_501950 [Shorea laevis]